MPKQNPHCLRHRRMAPRGGVSWAAQSVLPLVLVAIAGCGGQPDAQLLTYRQQFLLASRPAEAASLAEARDHLNDSGPVVLQGRVRFPEAAGDSAQRAMFVLTELSDHDQQAGHDAANCPFCKRRAAKATKAAVQFVDERGEVLPFSPERLFGLHEGDVVVVRGRGEWNELLNMLSITAEGMFVDEGPDR